MIIQYVSLSALIVLYSLMFIGGYISAAGLGLTCPDWPLCPELLPDEAFLIEWVHRLIAVTVGVLIGVTMALALRNKHADSKIRATSSIATVLVVIQITLGAIVIDTLLEAVLVAIHLGLGILLFAMVLLTTLFAFRLSRSVRASPST